MAITVNTPCIPRQHGLQRTIALPSGSCLSLDKTTINHKCEGTRYLNRCVRYVGRSTHFDPSPSAPFPALDKWRSAFPRRDMQRRYRPGQSPQPPQKWREVCSMTQSEPGQLISYAQKWNRSRTLKTIQPIPFINHGWGKLLKIT